MTEKERIDRIEDELRQTRETFEVIKGSLEEIKSIKMTIGAMQTPSRMRWDGFAWGALCALIVVFGCAILFSS